MTTGLALDHKTCMLRDIEAKTKTSIWWSVDEQGQPVYVAFEDDVNLSDIDEYYCSACHGFFACWQDVCDHLNQPKEMV